MYEYKVIPAPKKAAKIKGLRGTEQKFAGALAAIMNEYGALGWEYQRTDTLPCEERHGLTGKTTTFQNMLVFRRELRPAAQPAPAQTAAQQPAPAPVAPSVRSAVAAAAAPALAAVTENVPQGRAPELGAAKPAEPDSKSAGNPGVATH